MLSTLNSVIQSLPPIYPSYFNSLPWLPTFLLDVKQLLRSMDLSSQRCNDFSNWLSSEESICVHPRLNLTLQHSSLHCHFKQTSLSPPAAPMYVLPYLKYFTQCWQILEKGGLELIHHSYITFIFLPFPPMHYFLHILSCLY